jgi:hypothetical protein
MKLFVTYGWGSNLRHNFSVVEGEDTSACYDQINSTAGRNYAFAYSEADFEGQAERYGLTEVPLQAQILRPGQ